jgi:TRAP-type C4-dicarboxylate transport system permease small subunit
MWISRLQRHFDAVVKAGAFLAGVLFGLVVLLICVDVFMRYFLNRPLEGVLESTEYSLLFFTLLSATWLLKNGRHVRMDLVISRLKPRTRNILHVATSFLGAIVCAIVAYYGVLLVIRYFKTGHHLVSSLEPLAYPLVSIIPLAFFLMFVQFLISAFSALLNPASMGEDDASHGVVHGKQDRIESMKP